MGNQRSVGNTEYINSTELNVQPEEIVGRAWMVGVSSDCVVSSLPSVKWRSWILCNESHWVTLDNKISMVHTIDTINILPTS